MDAQDEPINSFTCPARSLELLSSGRCNKGSPVILPAVIEAIPNDTELTLAPTAAQQNARPAGGASQQPSVPPKV